MMRRRARLCPVLALFGGGCTAIPQHRANLHIVIMTIKCAAFALYVDFCSSWLHVALIVHHLASRPTRETDNDDVQPVR